MSEKIKRKIVSVWEDSESAGLAILLIIAIILGALAWAFGLMCFQSWIVMLLWNWVAVNLFDLPAIGFWMAFCLRWLCALLFKGTVTVNKSND